MRTKATNGKKQICKLFKDPPRFQGFIYNQVKNII